jgi:hypothetical protein
MSAPLTPKQEEQVREMVADALADRRLSMSQRDKVREIVWDVLGDFLTAIGTDDAYKVQKVATNMKARDAYEARAREVFNG